MESCVNMVERPEQIDAEDLKRDLSSEFSFLQTSVCRERGEHLQVFLRVRPFTSAESSGGEAQDCVTLHPPDTVLLRPPRLSLPNAASDRPLPHTGQHFQFSQVFGPETSQRDLFGGTVKGLVKEVLGGGNSLVFTYGVTNAGKTFTFLGPEGDAGLLPRSLALIFSSLEERLFSGSSVKPHRCREFTTLTPQQQEKEAQLKRSLLRQLKESEKSSLGQLNQTNKTLHEGSSLLRTSVLSEDSVILALEPNTKFSVWVSFCEIYNENIHDLLDSAPSAARRAALRLSQDVKGNSFVKDLRWVQVNSAEEAYRLMKLGKKNQSFSSTRLNQLSSRSHSIFSIRILKIEDVATPRVHAVSELCLCDLAGSERCAKTQNKGERLKEAGNINTSLHILGKVINALRHNQQARLLQHVPFRESKLTHYLQSFFLGRGRACMIVNINQNASMYDETLNVLKFSAVAQKVVVLSSQPPPAPPRTSHDLSIIINNADRKQLCSSGRRRSSLIGWDSSLEDVQEDEDDELEEEESQMEDETLYDEDAEDAVGPGNHLSQAERLEAELQAGRAEALLMEARVREEISREFSDLFTQMQRDYDERLVRERKILEERAETRMEIFKNLVNKMAAAEPSEGAMAMKTLLDSFCAELEGERRSCSAPCRCGGSAGRGQNGGDSSEADRKQLQEALEALAQERRAREEALAALEYQTLGKEEALEALEEERRGREEERRGREEERRGTEEERRGREEALEEERRGREEALEEERRGREEALEEERRGREELQVSLEELKEAQQRAEASLQAERRSREEAVGALIQERRSREEERGRRGEEERELRARLQAAEREVEQNLLQRRNLVQEQEENQQQLEEQLQLERRNPKPQEEEKIREELQEEKHREEVKTLRRELEQKTQSSETLVEELKEKLQEQETSSNRLLEELKEKLQEQETSSNRLLEELKEKLQEQETSSSRLLEELKEKLQEQETSSNRLLEELKEKLQEQETSSSRLLEELKEKLQEQETSSNRLLEELKEKLQEQETSSNRLLEEKLKEQETSSNRLLEELREQLREFRQSAELLKIQLEDTKTKCSSGSAPSPQEPLKRSSSSLQSCTSSPRVKVSRAEGAEPPGRLAEVEAELREREAEVTSLKRSLEEAQEEERRREQEAQEEERRREQEARQKEAERRRELMDAANDAIRQKDQQLEKKEEEIKGLKESVRQDSEKVNLLRLDLRRRDEDASDFREKMADYKKQIQQVQKEVCVMREEEKVLRLRLAEEERRRRQLQSEVAVRDRTIQQLKTDQSSSSDSVSTLQLYQKACKELEEKQRVVEDMRLALAEQEDTQEQMEEVLEEKLLLIQELSSDLEKLKAKLLQDDGGKEEEEERKTSEDLKEDKEEALKKLAEKHQAERRRWMEEKLSLIGQAKEAEHKRNQEMRKFAEDRERYAKQQSQLESQLEVKDQSLDQWRKERDALVAALEVQLQKLLSSHKEKDQLIQQLEGSTTLPPPGDEECVLGAAALQAALSEKESEMERLKEELRAAEEKLKEETSENGGVASPAAASGSAARDVRASVSSQGSGGFPVVLESSDIRTEDGSSSRRFPRPQLEISFSPLQPNRMELRRHGNQDAVTLKITRSARKRKSSEMERSLIFRRSKRPTKKEEDLVTENKKNTRTKLTPHKEESAAKKEGTLQKIGEFLQSSPTLLGSKAKKMMSLVSGRGEADAPPSSSSSSSSSLHLRPRKTKRRLYRPEISAPMEMPSHPILFREEEEKESDHQIIRRRLRSRHAKT